MTTTDPMHAANELKRQWADPPTETAPDAPDRPPT